MRNIQYLFIFFIAFTFGCASHDESASKSPITVRPFSGGKITGASISVYALNTDGTTGKLLATCTTDTSGSCVAAVPSSALGKPAVVTSTGGTLVSNNAVQALNVQASGTKGPSLSAPLAKLGYTSNGKSSKTVSPNPASSAAMRFAAAKAAKAARKVAAGKLHSMKMLGFRLYDSSPDEDITNFIEQASNVIAARLNLDDVARAQSKKIDTSKSTSNGSGYTPADDLSGDNPITLGYVDGMFDFFDKSSKIPDSADIGDVVSDFLTVAADSESTSALTAFSIDVDGTTFQMSSGDLTTMSTTIQNDVVSGVAAANADSANSNMTDIVISASDIPSVPDQAPTTASTTAQLGASDSTDPISITMIVTNPSPAPTDASWNFYLYSSADCSGASIDSWLGATLSYDPDLQNYPVGVTSAAISNATADAFYSISVSTGGLATCVSVTLLQPAQ